MMSRLIFLAALVVLASYAEAKPKSAFGMLQMSKTGFMAKTELKKSVEAVESDRASIQQTLREVYHKENPDIKEEEADEDEGVDPDAVEQNPDNEDDPADYSAHQFVVAEQEQRASEAEEVEDANPMSKEDDEDSGDDSEEDSDDSQKEEDEESFIQAGSKTKRTRDAFYKQHAAGWGNLMDSDGGEEYEFGQQTVAEQNDFSEGQYESNDPNDDENGYDGDYNTKETDHPDGDDEEEESEAEQEEDEKEGEDDNGQD